MTQKLICAAVLAAILTVFSADAEAARTTLVVTSNPITDLAVNGNRIAWLSVFEDEYHAELWTQDLPTKRRVRLHRMESAGGFWSVELLAFAGGRAVWRETYEDIHSDHEAYLYTASIAERRVRGMRDLYGAWFLWLKDSDRAPLVFGALSVDITNWEECNYEDEEPPTEECHYGPFGLLSRMDGRHERRLSVLPTPAMFSAHRGRVAVVPADASGTEPWVTPTVEVRQIQGGALIHRFELTSLPRAVTLSGSLLTVLIEDGTGGLRLERYRPSGAFLGATQVSRRTRPRLETDGQWVVFSAGHFLMALDGRNGVVSTLQRIRGGPIDLQASGGRAVWAANGLGHGRVLSVPLPTG